MDVGAWISYDEQMVKSTARAMFALMRYNPQKPIKHGELESEVAGGQPKVLVLVRLRVVEITPGPVVFKITSFLFELRTPVTSQRSVPTQTRASSVYFFYCCTLFLACAPTAHNFQRA